MTKSLLENLRKNGALHILTALLIETLILILVSFAGLLTLETILPGLISSRFVIGKLLIAAALILFLIAALSRFLGVTFPRTISRSFQFLCIGILVWTLCIMIISLLAFPLWSIPIILIIFGAIVFLAWKESKK